MNKQKQLCPKCNGVNFGDSLAGSFVCGDCNYELTTQQIYDQLQRTQWWLDEFKGSLGQCEADSLLLKEELKTLGNVAYKIFQAPFPLHDYCTKEDWEFACHFVAVLKNG